MCMQEAPIVTREWSKVSKQSEQTLSLVDDPAVNAGRTSIALLIRCARSALVGCDDDDEDNAAGYPSGDGETVMSAFPCCGGGSGAGGGAGMAVEDVV